MNVKSQDSPKPWVDPDDAEVIAAFKATGEGWQTRMNDALKDWLQTHSPAWRYDPPPLLPDLAGRRALVPRRQPLRAPRGVSRWENPVGYASWWSRSLAIFFRACGDETITPAFF